MKSASSSKVENMKKNFKTAAKKRNNQHCTRDFDQSIEESHILDLIGNNSVDKENYNKKFGIEEIFVDFESKILYLKLNFYLNLIFLEPLQIYAYLGLRHKHQVQSPTFSTFINFNYFSFNSHFF